MVQGATREVYVLDPTGDVHQVPRRRARRPGSIHGKVVGLLDNHMPNTDVFMDALGEVLLKEYGVARVIRRGKPNMSHPCPPDISQELLREADCLVAGVGV